MATGLALTVRAYQVATAGWLPGRCRYLPSCSAYAHQALLRHGAVVGLALTAWRLLRCQPFAAGGYDPVPPLPC